MSAPPGARVPSRTGRRLPEGTLSAEALAPLEALGYAGER